MGKHAPLGAKCGEVKEAKDEVGDLREIGCAEREDVTRESLRTSRSEKIVLRESNALRVLSAGLQDSVAEPKGLDETALCSLGSDWVLVCV